MRLLRNLLSFADLLYGNGMNAPKRGEDIRFNQIQER